MMLQEQLEKANNTRGETRGGQFYMNFYLGSTESCEGTATIIHQVWKIFNGHLRALLTVSKAPSL